MVFAVGFSEDMRPINVTLPGALDNTFFSSAFRVCDISKVSWKSNLFKKDRGKGPVFSQFIELLSGLVTIRAFGWSESYVEHNLKLLDESLKPYYLLFCIQRWLGLVLDMLVAGLAVFLIALAVSLCLQISAGFLGIALVNIMNLGQSLADLFKFLTALETFWGSLESKNLCRRN
ncbi:hypothetical protein BJ878DRAFT_556540 [Calycina marina]|uniref:ABC transmembrane type-1 domain-containing protein n=1 Tax=Calycina marina TaxID=1763456 RepID=A0A9P7YYG6_9HELO|nr:hypothetical protein BJ878DRAFT_556540 [Calycina marina]